MVNVLIVYPVQIVRLAIQMVALLALKPLLFQMANVSGNVMMGISIMAENVRLVILNAASVLDPMMINALNAPLDPIKQVTSVQWVQNICFNKK